MNKVRINNPCIDWFYTSELRVLNLIVVVVVAAVDVVVVIVVIVILGAVVV